MAVIDDFKGESFKKVELTLKLNIILNRMFRSISRISIGLLLLSAVLIIFHNECYYLSYQYVLGFGLFALLLSSCILISNRFLRGAVRTLLSILVLVTFFLYSLYDNYKMGYGIDIGKVFKYSEVPIIFIICWFITIVTTCKSIKNDVKLARYNHLKSLRFFKGFSIFLALVSVVMTVFYLVNNYESAITTNFPVLLNYYQFLLTYFVAQLVIIKTTNECVYAGIKQIEKQIHLPRKIAFGGGIAAITALLIAFKQKLNDALLKFLLSLTDLYFWFSKYVKELIEYIKRILEAISLRPPRRETSNNISKTQNGILKDFGLGGLKPDQSGNGGGGDGFGGAGGIGGFGSLGGDGELSGNGAGTISGGMSQSGEIGLGGGKLPEGGNKSAIAFVKADETAYLYLKLKSFGDYNGNGWNDAPVYTEYLVDDNNSYSMNYLTGTALYNAGVQTTTLEISSLTGQYFLPDYIAMGNFHYTIQNSDVLNVGKTSDVYSVEFYSYSGYSINGYVNARYFLNEQNYRYYVYINYLQLPDDTKTQIQQFLSEQGIDANSPTVVQDVLMIFAQYTYNRQYNQDVDDADDVVMSFLTEYREGICQHFASSAVVMYRSLGIPARYVGGLYVGALNADEWTVVTADAAHAWVEIYVDGVGWVRIDPTAYSKVVGETVDGTYSAEEYKQEILNNQNSANQGGFGEDSSFVGEDSSFDSGEDSSLDSSEDNEDSSIDSGEDGEDSENSSSFDEEGESSFEDSSIDNPWKEPEESSSQTQTIQIGLFEGCNFEDIPWSTICIVGGVLLTSVLAFALLAHLRKNKDARVKKVKTVVENLSVEAIDGNNKEVTDEEVLLATQIIRENYKEFIKIAGRYGIRRYPVDTTQSLRSKYNQAMGASEAMEILTALYRIARYNKNERLSMDDANQSKLCLEIIKQSFEKPEDKADE